MKLAANVRHEVVGSITSTKIAIDITAMIHQNINTSTDTDAIVIGDESTLYVSICSKKKTSDE